MKNKTVLYAEDDPMVRKIMNMILKREFKTVYMAINGREAYDIFREYKPDIVITDLAMPEINGFELISKIRAEKPDTKIMVTTAYREETKDLHDITCLYKPIDRDELFRCLKQLL